MSYVQSSNKLQPDCYSVGFKDGMSTAVH